MTDRVRKLVVILDDDYRVDALGDIMSALSMVRGVKAVDLEDVVTSADYINREVIRDELRGKVLAVLAPERSKKG